MEYQQQRIEGFSLGHMEDKIDLISPRTFEQKIEHVKQNIHVAALRECMQNQYLQYNTYWESLNSPAMDNIFSTTTEQMGLGDFRVNTYKPEKFNAPNKPRYEVINHIRTTPPIYIFQDKINDMANYNYSAQSNHIGADIGRSMGIGFSDRIALNLASRAQEQNQIIKLSNHKSISQSLKESAENIHCSDHKHCGQVFAMLNFRAYNHLINVIPHIFNSLSLLPIKHFKSPIFSKNLSNDETYPEAYRRDYKNIIGLVWSTYAVSVSFQEKFNVRLDYATDTPYVAAAGYMNFNVYDLLPDEVFVIVDEGQNH